MNSLYVVRDFHRDFIMLAIIDAPVVSTTVSFLCAKSKNENLP